MTRLLLDQGLPRSAAALLRERGWDVVHVGELGLAAATDRDILARALHEQRVVCTLDADFHALLAFSGASAPSVIRLRRQGLKAAALAEWLAKCWPRLASAVAKGALVTLTEREVRVHYLPIKAAHSNNSKRD